MRDHAALPASRVLDVAFHEFLADEIGMVRRVYQHFGLPFTVVAEARMRRFLAGNRADQHGRHRYRLALGGLDEASERRRFAAYQERYAIPPEPTA